MKKAAVKRATSRAVAVPALLSLGAVACAHRGATIVPASSEDDAAQVRFFSPPISLAAPEDAIVRVLSSQGSCSGTLVDDDLVLTAHHCVAMRDEKGHFTKALVPPSEIHVELGGDYLAWGSVGVTHVVAPPCGESGGAGDIAVLVLQRKIVGLGAMTPRLDKPPKMDEPLDPAGFGRCLMSGDGIKRNVRAGGTLSSMAPQTLSLKASVCPGDSGGPLLARGTHEVVGVVSMSAMDGDDRTASASLMARIDAFRPVFAHARQIADGVAASELPPLSCKELAPEK